MNHVMNRIALYHNLYFLCLMTAGIFVCVSIVIFIRMDIKNSISFLSGKREKKEIQQLRIKSTNEKNQEKFCAGREIMFIHANEIIE